MPISYLTMDFIHRQAFRRTRHVHPQVDTGEAFVYLVPLGRALWLTVAVRACVYLLQSCSRDGVAR
jgi:hypothetical protein